MYRVHQRLLPAGILYPAESVVPESKYLLPGPVRVIRVKAAGPNELHEPAFVSVIIEIKVDGNDFFRQGAGQYTVKP